MEKQNAYLMLAAQYAKLSSATALPTIKAWGQSPRAGIALDFGALDGSDSQFRRYAEAFRDSIDLTAIHAAALDRLRTRLELARQEAEAEAIDFIKNNGAPLTAPAPKEV